MDKENLTKSPSTIDELIPNWKEEIDSCYISSSYIPTMLKILMQLVKDRNVEGIRMFQHKICTDTIDLNDRDEFFHNFIAWFTNLKKYEEVKYKNEEPQIMNDYLCFRSIYHRGKKDEFYVDTFFTKRELMEAPYKYQCFLMYNNLVGMETFLHTYEFSKPYLEEQYFSKCNNLVLTFKWNETNKEKLINPAIYLSWDWYKEIKEEFEKFDLKFRHIMTNGEDLIVIVNLKRSINLKEKNLKFVFENVKKEFYNKFSELNIYDNENFFMVPGSINITKPVEFSTFNNVLYFKNKKLYDNDIIVQENGYKRCYYLGEDYYCEDSIDFSNLANILGLLQKPRNKKFYTKQHENNYKIYKHVGEQRLEDFDTLLLYRNFKIDNVFLFFSIMANVLFFLGKTKLEVIDYLKSKNLLLVNPISDRKIINIVTFNEENFEIYKTNTNLGIKYSNDTIVNKLHITEYEQDKMHQLISKDTVNLRTSYHKTIYARNQYKIIKQQNKSKKDNEFIDIMNLKFNNMNCNEISLAKNCDYRTVKNIVGNEFYDLNNLIMSDYQSGFSIKELSEKYKMSKTKLNKILR